MTRTATLTLLLCLCASGVPAMETAAARTLTESIVDLDGDGAFDRVAVLLTSGGAVPGAKLCDCDEVLEGTVSLAVTFADGRTASTPLTPLFGVESLRLCDRPWALVLMDYDGDGALDLNLGQLDDCNAWRYKLLALDGDGKARELCVPGGTLRVCDRANSTANIFRKPGCVRYTTRTGGEKGHYVTLDLRWDPDGACFVQARQVAKVPVVPPKRGTAKGATKK